MIVFDFNEHIDVNSPENYFENFYAHVWINSFGDNSAYDEEIVTALTSEIKKHGGKRVYRKIFNQPFSSVSRYVMEFEYEEDFIMFKLRFS